MSKPTVLNFKVDSQLLGEIGEKLVTNNYIALAELIKNSYDADSTTVEVTFENVTESSPQSKIIVKDSGVGMSFSEVKANWMRIATSNKLNEPTSNYFGRNKTGNKGIGRFACQRLAKELVLETTAKVGNRFETTSVTFVWDLFVPGTDIDKINCEYTVSQSNSGETGLKLTLKGLRDRWLNKDFTMLQRNISVLSVTGQTKREGYPVDPGIKITLCSEEFDAEQKDLGKEYRKAGWGSLKGRILKNGTVELELDYLGSDVITYELPEQFEELYSISFELDWLPFRKEFENRRNPKLLTHGVHTQLLKDQSGVRVYLDGFRVYPYGESTDDWLKIVADTSRRQGSVKNPVLESLAKKMGLNSSTVLLSYPSNRNIIGEVKISTEIHNPFVVKMDREGLIENEAFMHLVDMIRLSLDWMTLHYEKQKILDKKKRQDKANMEFEEAIRPQGKPKGDTFNNALQYLEKAARTIESTKEDTSQPKKTNRAPETVSTIALEISHVTKASEVVKQRVKQQDDELALLRAIASTGPLMFVFAHEVKGITAGLDSNAAYIDRVKSLIADASLKKDLSEISTNLRDTRTRFNQLDALFNVFGAAHQNKPTQLSIKTIAEKVKGAFGFVLNKFSIDVDTSGINQLILTPIMNEAECYSVFVNLLSNAVKACIVSGGDKIQITANKSNATLSVVFQDNGLGLNPDFWDSVFDPLEVDPENKMYKPLMHKLKDETLSTLGRGSGLGLSIVKSIVERLRGRIYFSQPQGNWKTSIIIELPVQRGK